MSAPAKRSLRIALTLATLAFTATLIIWKHSPARPSAPTPKSPPEIQASATPFHPEREAQRLRNALQSQGLAALDLITAEMPGTFRNQIRQELLETHGRSRPLEVLDWLAAHPSIPGSGPWGVELTASLHTRAGASAGSTEDWSTALTRLAKISTHGTQREHMAYAAACLDALAPHASPPFTADSLLALDLPPAVSAPALASLGEVRRALDLLPPTPDNLEAAQLSVRRWLSLGLSHPPTEEICTRLLAFTNRDDAATATVARTLRHPLRDTSIATWLISCPPGPNRDQILREIATEIAHFDPTLADTYLHELNPKD